VSSTPTLTSSVFKENTAETFVSSSMGASPTARNVLVSYRNIGALTDPVTNSLVGNLNEKNYKKEEKLCMLLTVALNKRENWPKPESAGQT